MNYITTSTLHNLQYIHIYIYIYIYNIYIYIYIIIMMKKIISLLLLSLYRERERERQTYRDRDTHTCEARVHSPGCLASTSCARHPAKSLQDVLGHVRSTLPAAPLSLLLELQLVLDPLAQRAPDV